MEQGTKNGTTSIHVNNKVIQIPPLRIFFEGVFFLLLVVN
jgi:hypothetical protein